MQDRAADPAGDINSVRNSAGQGNSAADPKFTNHDGNSLTLKADSRGIDAGNTFIDLNITIAGAQLPSEAEDPTGNGRVQGSGQAFFDLGCYES